MTRTANFPTIKVRGSGIPKAVCNTIVQRQRPSPNALWIEFKIIDDHRRLEAWSACEARLLPWNRRNAPKSPNHP
jgi:hypothetical protein